MSRLRFLITGGAGFIDSALVRHLISESDHEVLCLDKLTYAGNLDSLSVIEPSPTSARMTSSGSRTSTGGPIQERYPSDGLPIAESREGVLMSRILVVGGAGYIESHMMKAFARAGHEPVAFDNLSTGHADAGRAKAELHWSPRRDRLSQIVGDAWNFYRRCHERKHLAV